MFYARFKYTEPYEDNLSEEDVPLEKYNTDFMTAMETAKAEFIKSHPNITHFRVSVHFEEEYIYKDEKGFWQELKNG